MTEIPSTIVTVNAVAELRAHLDAHRGAGRTVGLVPTMGFLHDGHGSLMGRAAVENDVVVATIFVNPLQFAPDEDLDSYPRDLKRDTVLAEEAGANYLFVPTREEMYPFEPVLTTVRVGTLSDLWEAGTRPTHFSGVATVVTKLFAIGGECKAYFGEKDFQQLAIVTRLAADLSLPVTVVGCPIVREPDGLAMSSRNTYLTGDHRTAAAVLRQALDVGEAAIAAGERDPQIVMAEMAAIVEDEPLAELDYVAAVDAATLEMPPVLAGEIRLLIAAQVGRPRLIDNCGVTIT